MSTESERSVDREGCLDAAATALAECYRAIEEAETTTASAGAEAA